MSGNPYWHMAKMAFVLGAASAAGGLVVSTGYRLVKRVADSVVTLREEEDADGMFEDEYVEKVKKPKGT